MNLWLRLFFIYATKLWRKPTKGFFDDFSLSLRVWPTEADLRLFNNARYLALMEMARTDMMVQTGVFLFALRRRWVPLVAAQTIRYKRPLYRFQSFELKSRVIGFDDKFVYIEQIFTRKSKLMAAGIAKACFLAKEGVIPPEKIFELLGTPVQRTELPDAVIKWNESEGAFFKNL